MSQNSGNKSCATTEGPAQNRGGADRAKHTEQSIPARRGRRTLYTPELAATICQRIAEGESLASITREQKMPSYPTMMEWLKSNSDFATMYRQARDDQADTLADEIISIADSVRDSEDNAKVNAARLAVDARKWVAAKLKPKIYGERVSAALSGTVTVQHTLTDEDRAKALDGLLARLMVRSAPNMHEAQRFIRQRGHNSK